jgi:hypothetical protein
MHLMDSSAPIATLPKIAIHTEKPLDTKAFDRYVGVYEFAPGATLTFSREGEHAYVQLTGQPKFEIFAESEKAFFLKVVDAQVVFETDATGRATAVTLHQNGQEHRAPRMP